MNDSLIPKKEKRGFGLLLNPFETIAGAQALVIGLAGIIIASLIACRAHCFFEGVIDAVIVSTVKEPWLVYTVQGLVNWFVLATLIMVSGRLVAKSKYRLLDVFGTQALARLPYVLVAAISLLPTMTRYPLYLQATYAKTSSIPVIQPYDIYIYITAVTLVLAGIIWAILLMYRAFSVSCNARGQKAVWYFIAVVVIGEIITKLLYGFYDLHLHK